MSLDIARKDTICALSSAQGYGAIAIVRASGLNAEEIFTKIFRKKRGEAKPFMAMYGDILDAAGEVIDEVMALMFPHGHSFTGESSFEIHCHGNQLIIDQILQAICAKGARLAEPGEFSLRAMLNNKIDLAQAESILDLIHAKTTAAKHVALKGVQGGLKQKTALVRDGIIEVLAEIEARMDFPDEDLGGYDRAHLVKKIDASSEILQKILDSAAHALKLHEGARIVICGVPNAGKSTLFNRLCDEDRAIVHESAGTTRDVLVATLLLKDVPLTLIDVAGIRTVDEGVEKIGIDRAFAELKRAQLVVWLEDCLSPNPFLDPAIKQALSELETPILRVLNKIELLDKSVHADGVLTISAEKNIGVEELKSTIYEILVGRTSEMNEMFITRARQRDEIKLALQSLEEAKKAWILGWADEVVTSELRSAGLAFDRLFGTELSEEILDKIFSEFCIGK